MAGVVQVPWYATLFRADAFEQALNEVAPVALRYGASAYWVYRARDDRYKFMQLSQFEEKLDWERYWDGPEMIDFRVRHCPQKALPLLDRNGKTAGASIAVTSPRPNAANQV